jgi:hypothetical protein
MAAARAAEDAHPDALCRRRLVVCGLGRLPGRQRLLRTLLEAITGTVPAVLDTRGIGDSYPRRIHRRWIRFIPSSRGQPMPDHSEMLSWQADFLLITA